MRKLSSISPAQAWLAHSASTASIIPKTLRITASSGAAPLPLSSTTAERRRRSRRVLYFAACGLRQIVLPASRMPARTRLVVLVLLLGCGSDETKVDLTGIDLQVDRRPLEATLQLSEEDFAADDCAVIEGAVAAPGRRRLL